MNKTKDLVGATFRALGVSGLVASIGLAASGCLAAAVAGAAAYGGTKMAQNGGNKNDKELVRSRYSEVIYNDNGKEIRVCGGDLYRNNQGGFYLLEGIVYNPCSDLCDDCVIGSESRTFAFAAYKNLKFE